MHSDEAEWREFLIKLGEQYSRLEAARRSCRRSTDTLPPVQCAYCDHEHSNYGWARGHVRYSCPSCGVAFVQ